MSPEQVTGKRLAVDLRTDIYSLGLVLYELLTLSRPIFGRTREELLKAILTKPLFPVTWRNQSIPRSLESIVHRATAKDPDERYQTAAHFVEDLQRFLAGEPVDAPAYHYKFDEREIRADRPGTVTAVAFLFYCAAVFYTLMWMPFQISSETGAAAALKTPAPNLIPFVVACLGCSAIGCAVGRFLLAGRVWARLWGIGLAVVGAGHSAWQGGQFIYYALRLESWNRTWHYFQVMAVWIIPLVVIALGGVFAIYVLMLQRSADAWFRTSRHIRLEHDELATAVQTGRWRLPDSADKPTTK